ncbi:MAG TPA: hypothetical protein VJZ72_00065 [Candidatus Limnocylindrales bacterium]|nr:hypothetical protein [Candidatus Limnocylindrales bacterium]
MGYGLPLGGQRLVVAERSSRITGREIVIPRLRADPDRLPSAPSIWDKEFGASATMPSGYTVTGTISAWDFNRTVKGHLYIKTGGASAGYAGIFWPSPPGPFTVTAKIAAMQMLPTVAAQSQQPRLELGTSTIASLGTHPQIGVITSGDGTTNCLVQSGINNTYVGSGTSPAYALLQPHYLRMIVTSGNSVTCQFSFDGLIWTTLQGPTASAITIASMGFGARDLATSYAFAVAWLRVTTP